MDPYTFTHGDSPLVLSIPHAGTHAPQDILQRMTTEARELPDTDWHVDRLYDFAGEMNITIIKGNHSRFVIDLNRPPDDASLYPGQATTGLCPVTLFSGNPIYLEGQEPGKDEISQRIDEIWRPYHNRLQRCMEEKTERHGYALLYEAHSIRSEVPRLFEGRLPDLNLGTNDGHSAATDLQDRLYSICESAEGYTAVLNGRFKGGYITRHYGNPDNNAHAVQLEMTQHCYMNESYPYNYLPGNALKTREILKGLLDAMLAWKPNQQ